MFEDFQRRMERRGRYMGEILRNQSDIVTNATWEQSVSTYPVMVHFVKYGMPPEYSSKDDYISPIYAHFETKNVYTAGSNEPAYYLTFRPGDIVEHREIKIGSYVNIPTRDGVCQYWMIVHFDDDNETIRVQILKCTWILKWVKDNVIYSTLCVVRNGAAENIGVETEGQVSTVDSDMFIWVPTNRETQTIGYDTRFLISDDGRFPPLAWSVARLRDIGPTGITRISLTQDLYNSNSDNAELMLADYTDRAVTATYPRKKCKKFYLEYNGTKPSVKVGSYKNFNAVLPDDNHFDIMWKLIDGEIEHSTNSYENGTYTFGDYYTLITTDRTAQLKVARNYNIVGTLLTIKAECANGDVSSIQVEVVS